MTQASQSTTTRHSLSPSRRWVLFGWSLLRLIIVFPLWLIGLVMLLSGLALSPWGTGFLLSQGEQRGFYNLEHHEGDLLSHLVLEGFSLEAGSAQVDVSRFELKWADDCLLSGRLCIDRLHIEGADVRLLPTDDAEEAPQEETGNIVLPDIEFPFRIELRSLELEDIALHLADGKRFHWKRFSSGAIAEANQLQLLATKLVEPRLYLPPSPGVLLTENTDTPLDAQAINTAIALHQPEEVSVAEEPPLQEVEDTLEKRARLALPEVTLPLEVQIPQLSIDDFQVEGAVAYTVEHLALSAVARRHEIEVQRLNVVTPDAEATLETSAILSEDYPLNATLNVRLNNEGGLLDDYPALVGQQIELHLDGSLSALQVALNIRGALNATLRGEVDVLAPEMPFQLNIASERLQWPLQQDEATAESAPYVVENLVANLDGSLTDYRVGLSLVTEGPQVPRTRVALTGEGDLEHFRWTPLSLTLGEGSLVSHGRMDWLDTLQVQARLRLDQLDPSLFIEELEGRLNGDLELAFAQQDNDWTVSIPTLSIDGRLQDYPLSLQAALEADSDLRVQLERFDFAQGENRLQASGLVSEQQMDVDADIDLRQLESLHPELAGLLSGNVQAQGSLSQPNVMVDLRGSDLRFAENNLETLALEGRMQGVDDPDIDLQLDIQNLNAAGQRLEMLALSLQGRVSDHRLRLEAQGGPNAAFSRAQLALDGRFNQQAGRYQGDLNSLEVDAEIGDIRLNREVAVNYDLNTGQAQLSPFCLRRQQGGVLCLDQPLQASAEQGQASLTLRDVPMEMLEMGLPEGWQLEGDTTADVLATWGQGGAQWQADLRLISELAITALNDFGQPVSLPRTRLDTRVEATQTQARVEATLTLADAGEVGLDLTIDEPIGEGRLNGVISADDISLRPYRSLVVGMDVLEGNLGGEIQLSGTTTAPDLQGRLRLQGIQASGMDIPVEVEDGNIEVRLEGDRGDINGFLAAERGRLEITGDAYWPGGDEWRIGVDLSAVESPLLVVLPEFGRLEAAPDLRIRVTSDLLQVRGNVDIPWARLEVGDIPASAISPSQDEIIITQRDEREAELAAERAAAAATRNEGPDTSEELAQTGIMVDVLITLSLGPDMMISAYGLESGLSGTLEVRQEGGALQLFGDVNLVDGRFKAFGQDLLIRRGTLLFSGPPDLPILDFEAIRNPDTTQDDVIAGLRVSGSAEEPNVSIFSEPAMNETRALSYLLRGRPPEGDGGSVEGALVTGLIGMSLGRTGSAIGSIGESFGVDDLTLETTGAGEESQIAVSGQLTDDLSISYGVGIFSPIAELTLRYTLWRNLYVQVVSGANQAVDLVYTFSRSGDPEILEQR
ncbi:autotransporter assembly complex protein TamB [Vreelandella zhuhanensis]|nr:translocation/assembly module TamB domain-containing protein [Halomonas zhuhanensis]